MIQGHPIGMAPMPVPPTLGKQDGKMVLWLPSLSNQMLQQPPTLPEVPWHLRQGGGACPPQREAMGPLKSLSQQHAAWVARSHGPSVLL